MDVSEITYNEETKEYSITIKSKYRSNLAIIRNMMQ